MFYTHLTGAVLVPNTQNISHYREEVPLFVRGPLSHHHHQLCARTIDTINYRRTGRLARVELHRRRHVCNNNGFHKAQIKSHNDPGGGGVVDCCCVQPNSHGPPPPPATTINNHQHNPSIKLLTQPVSAYE